MNRNGADSSAPFIAKAIYGLVWVGGALSALLILIAFGFTLIAVFWRYVLDQPLLWPEDVTGWTLVGLIMLGVSEAYRRGDHIAIDLLASRLDGPVSTAQTIWTHLAILAFAAILGLSAWEAVTFARDFGAYTSGNVEIAAWIPKAPMIAGSVLLGLTALAKIIETLAGRQRG